jgi:hypothetical protein
MYLLLLYALGSDLVAGGPLGGNVSVAELAMPKQLSERVLLLEVSLVAEVGPLPERLRVALIILEIPSRDPGLLALRGRLLRRLGLSSPWVSPPIRWLLLRPAIHLCLPQRLLLLRQRWRRRWSILYYRALGTTPSHLTPLAPSTQPPLA